MTSTAFINREELAQSKVTLNGNPAVISGILNDFATITNPKTGEHYEWSWNAVDRIVSKGGNFKS